MCGPRSASSGSALPPGFLAVLALFAGWDLPGIHKAHPVLVFISTEFNEYLFCSCKCQALRDAKDTFYEQDHTLLKFTAQRG